MENVREYGFDPAYAQDVAYVEQTSGDYEIYPTVMDYVASMDTEGILELSDKCWAEYGEHYTDLEEHDLLDILRGLRHVLEETGYKDTTRTISMHLTREAAQQYIIDNMHRYKGPLRLYVESLYRNQEMIKLIQAILSGQIGWIKKEEEEERIFPSDVKRSNPWIA